ncbi:TCP11 isoform 28 [Pongo abelii]|uniref:TCP11 isoform 28 n=4 Tax=Pongo abelii TaxID=9601 RepID=A0A2J8Y3A4_PONAB|nr:TCP11 isoform 4 [Pongo abelii]PNJ88746.1 TCP11 isoform 5 [Pongo abelii]PNJ88748.1 TCP11 isoform 7 [Pongo abelii]PNJ88766.1 TCP11 isoform 28 [Pongo abelii]
MTRGGGGGDTISKMPDVEESVPPKDPDDSEGRSCKPETSGPPQEDKSGPEDPPP